METQKSCWPECFHANFDEEWRVIENVVGWKRYKLRVVNWRKEQVLFVQIPLHVLEIRMLLFFGSRRALLMSGFYDLFHGKVRKSLLYMAFLKFLHLKIFSVPNCQIWELHVLNPVICYSIVKGLENLGISYLKDEFSG